MLVSNISIFKTSLAIYFWGIRNAFKLLDKISGWTNITKDFLVKVISIEWSKTGYFFRRQKKRRRIFNSLFYSFAIDNAFNQSGPVFINSEEVEEYSDIYRFPPEIKANKKSFSLTLLGYDKDQQMAFTQLVCDADVDELIATIFDTHPEVEYLHARNAEACCYICQIERLN